MPGIPPRLACARSSRPSDLTFSWDSPPFLRNEIVGYRVKVKGLAHRDGTREVIQFDVANLATAMREVTLTQGIGKKKGNKI